MKPPSRGRGGEPPIEHRFKPGQSGNPGGRPKKTPSLREVGLRLMDEPVRVPGQNEALTRGEVLMRTAFSHAARDPQALFRLLRFLYGDQPALGPPEAACEPDADDQAIIDQALARAARRQQAAGSKRRTKPDGEA